MVSPKIIDLTFKTVRCPLIATLESNLLSIKVAYFSPENTEFSMIVIDVASDTNGMTRKRNIAWESLYSNPMYTGINVMLLSYREWVVRKLSERISYSSFVFTMIDERTWNKWKSAGSTKTKSMFIGMVAWQFDWNSMNTVIVA